MVPNLSITQLDQRLKPAIQAKINSKTKPLGALGQLESLALQIALIQQTAEPVINQPTLLVFAGDHGITEEGISPYPQAVTYQMVLNFLSGGAAVNVFARQHGLQLRIIDAGVNADFENNPSLLQAKVAKGTANFRWEPAMSDVQCMTAIEHGRRIAQQEIKAGSNVLGFGEMGIGNTSSASAIMSSLCQLDIKLCAGRGTGLDDPGLLHKQTVIQEALTRHQSALGKPFETLCCLGGFEIAMMTGAMLGGAEHGAVLIIDGFISSCALLVAAQMQPAILDYCVFSHCSAEQGHQLLLEKLGATPLLTLEMRLGEGSAAALAFPIVKAAVSFLNEMASFDSAQVSERRL